MMDKQDIKAQTELGQKLAGEFGKMGRVRPAYEPENMGDDVSSEGTGAAGTSPLAKPYILSFYGLKK